MTRILSVVGLLALIVAGSAILMALLERFRILVWAGGALLGWVAGDIMATDPAVISYTSAGTQHLLHTWGGPVGALLVVAAGYMAVKKHRALQLDEILAGIGLVIWIIVDRISEGMFGTDAVKIWSVRGVLLVGLLIAYMIARSRSQGSAAEKA